MTHAERAIEAGDWFRARGFNCIPSDLALGHPRRPYAAFRDGGMPRAEFVKRVLAGETNLQTACGSAWGLAVVDLDGECAIGQWATWTAIHGTTAPTWTVSTPRGGRHLWFSAAPGRKVPNRQLLKIPGVHDSIDLLGDGALAKCPPSSKAGVPYAWAEGRAPGDLAMAPLPAWVVPLAESVRVRRPGEANPIAACSDRTLKRSAYPVGTDWRDVKAAIRDKVGLMRSWGLRVVSETPNAAGWVTCRAIGREDRTPSARVNAESGAYWEPSVGCINIFGVGIALGAFPDFPTAVRSLSNTI